MMKCYMVYTLFRVFLTMISFIIIGLSFSNLIDNLKYAVYVNDNNGAIILQWWLTLFNFLLMLLYAVVTITIVHNYHKNKIILKNIAYDCFHIFACSLVYIVTLLFCILIYTNNNSDVTYKICNILALYTILNTFILTNSIIYHIKKNSYEDSDDSPSPILKFGYINLYFAADS